MNKLLIALALCTALSACKQDEPAAPAITGAETPAAAPAAPAAAVPALAAPAENIPPAVDPAAAPGDAATASTLPADCEAYIKRARACFAKAGPSADEMKTAFEQGFAQIATASADDREGACAMSQYVFEKEVAPKLKCE